MSISRLRLESGAEFHVAQTTLRIHPDVVKALRTSEREVLEEIEAHLGNIDLMADPHVHQGQFDFAFF